MSIESSRKRCLNGGASLLALTVALGCGSSTQGPASELTVGGAGAGGSGLVLTGGADGGFDVASSANAGAGAECERHVSLAAVTLGEPPPFDLGHRG